MVIRIYHRKAPKWFEPYHVDLKVDKPNVHVWMVSYMWLFIATILFFGKKKMNVFNTIGDTLL